MDNKRYNGWTNCETWAVALWMDNDQGSYTYWREQAVTHYEEAKEDKQVIEKVWTRHSAARYRLAEQIQYEFEEASPLADQTNIYSDLLGAALSEVDWREIAEHLIDDVIDNANEE